MWRLVLSKKENIVQEEAARRINVVHVIIRCVGFVKSQTIVRDLGGYIPPRYPACSFGHRGRPVKLCCQLDHAHTTCCIFIRKSLRNLYMALEYASVQHTLLVSIFWNMGIFYRHWFPTSLVTMKIQIIVEGFKLNGTHRFADGLFLSTWCTNSLF